jgi:hypothetical protein
MMAVAEDPNSRLVDTRRRDDSLHGAFDSLGYDVRRVETGCNNRMAECNPHLFHSCFIQRELI